MGFTANYDKNYFIHADYSFQHSARLSFGVQVLDGLQLSYSIQKMFESDFTGRSSSHEILIGYTINRKKTDNSKLTQSLEELFAPKHTGKNVTTTAMRMDQGSKGDELASTRQYMANPSAVRLDSNNLAIIRQNATANRKSVVVNTSGKVKLQKDLNDTTSTKYDQLFVKSYSTTDLLRQRSLPITNADRFVYDFQKIKEDKTLLLFGVYTSQALAEENRAKINNSGIEVHENSNNGLFYLILPCKTKMNEEEFKSTWASINSSNTKFWVLDFTN